MIKVLFLIPIIGIITAEQLIYETPVAYAQINPIVNVPQLNEYSQNNLERNQLYKKPLTEDRIDGWSTYTAIDPYGTKAKVKYTAHSLRGVQMHAAPLVSVGKNGGYSLGHTEALYDQETPLASAVKTNNVVYHL